MGCVESSQKSKHKYKGRFRPQAKPCKAGYLLYYSEHTSKWKKVFVILFKDSTLAWFNKPKEKQPINHVQLTNVCSMLVVGPVCTKIPTCPRSLPKKMSYSFMIAFPQFVTYNAAPGQLNSPVCYFLCPNGSTMGGWMTAISETLPPPAANPSAVPAQPSAPPPPGWNVNTGGPAPYPPGGPAYPPGGSAYPPTQYNTNTHVIKETKYKRKHSNDMTAGFLAGAALGYGFGHPWGYGWGWGWGYHSCYGWGYGDYDMDVDVDYNVHIHNEYDSQSVGSFGGSDFQDYGNDGDHGDMGNGTGYEGEDFGMANYDDGDYGGGDYGGGDYGGGGWGGGSCGGGGDFGGGGGCGGGGSCGGGGGCGGGGCGGGGCGGGGCGGGGCGGGCGG